MLDTTYDIDWELVVRFTEINVPEIYVIRTKYRKVHVL
jgi:hypothetical protein